MTSRREFVQIGITMTALPLASPALLAAVSTDGPELLSLERVVYDRRFAASRAFGERASALGLRTAAIEGDMTRLWYDDLYHVWQRGPAAIAGLTAYGTMFCFEQLAQQARMRLVFRAEHGPDADGSVTHMLEGPRGMLGMAADLDVCGADWAGRMADVVARCPRGRAELAQLTRAGGPAATFDHPEMLYSWVIAPAVKV